MSQHTVGRSGNSAQIDLRMQLHHCHELVPFPGSGTSIATILMCSLAAKLSFAVSAEALEAAPLVQSLLSVGHTKSKQNKMQSRGETRARGRAG